MAANTSGVPPSAPSGPSGTPNPRRRKRWPWVVLAGLVLIAIITAATGSKHPPKNSANAAASKGASTTSSTSATSTSTTSGHTASTTTTTSTTTTPPPTAPPGPSTTFGDGTWTVGKQIAAGTYYTKGGSNCYWARLSGFSGTLTSTLANTDPQGQSIVTVLPSDAGFKSAGCGQWSPLPSSGHSLSSFSDGNWAVGITISPGTYSAPGGSNCYWARESGFTGTLASVLANTDPTGPTVVTISPTDKGFKTSGCGTWKLQ